MKTIRPVDLLLPRSALLGCAVLALLLAPADRGAAGYAPPVPSCAESFHGVGDPECVDDGTPVRRVGGGSETPSINVVGGR